MNCNYLFENLNVRVIQLQASKTPARSAATSAAANHSLSFTTLSRTAHYLSSYSLWENKAKLKSQFLPTKPSNFVASFVSVQIAKNHLLHKTCLIQVCLECFWLAITI